MTTLTLIEPDEVTRTFLADNFTCDGYVVKAFATTAEAETIADVLIVNVDGGERDALELIAEAGTAPAVIAMTRSHARIDAWRSSEMWMDDYVQAPFSYPELRAVAAKLARRIERRPDNVLTVGPLEVHPDRTVLLHGRSVNLSQKEHALLRTLASEPTRMFTKEELLRDVWGFRSLGSTRTLDSHAVRLRQKLTAEGDRLVVNVWGVGYRLVDAPIAA